jgi:hypothetical protein
MKGHKSNTGVNRAEGHSGREAKCVQQILFNQRRLRMKTRHLVLIIFAAISLQVWVTATASAAGTSWNKNMSAVKQVLGDFWIPIPSSHAALSSISVTPKYNVL